MPADRVKVAYVSGTFPLVTHSFILRELGGLRALGVRLESYAVRLPGPEHLCLGDVAQEAARTKYLLPTTLGELLSSHWSVFIRGRRRYLGALRLAGRTFQGGWKAALYQAFYFAEAGLLARRWQQAPPDLVHGHFGGSATTLAMLAAELSGLPFSFTLHGSDNFADPDGRALPEKIRRASLVVCISRDACRQARSLARRQDWEKLHIVRCGVDTAIPQTPPGSGHRLVYVGRLVRAKGLSVLLESLGELRRQCPEVRLTLVGEGADRAALEAQTARLGLGDAVRFVGALDYSAVREVLSDSDILVLPSFAEGISVSVMEAMARGLTVIATPVGGMAELVEHGVNGWMVPPGDAQALTRALSTLVADRELRARLGAGARARVRADFDQNSSARRLCELFLSAAASPTDGPVARR
jgi:glycosyltransferase involved in cell wall biosynthesis